MLCLIFYFVGDNIISRMFSVEIPFPSVVYAMFSYCHVIVYIQIEKYNLFKQYCFVFMHTLCVRAIFSYFVSSSNTAPYIPFHIWPCYSLLNCIPHRYCK